MHGRACPLPTPGCAFCKRTYWDYNLGRKGFARKDLKRGRPQGAGRFVSAGRGGECSVGAPGWGHWGAVYISRRMPGLFKWTLLQLAGDESTVSLGLLAKALHPRGTWSLCRKCPQTESRCLSFQVRRRTWEFGDPSENTEMGLRACMPCFLGNALPWPVRPRAGGCSDGPGPAGQVTVP